MTAGSLLRHLHLAAPPIGRHVQPMVIDVSVNATTVTADVQLTGTIFHAFVIAPDLGTDQFTFSILDEDADEYYNSGAKDGNADYFLSPGVSVVGTITLKIEASAAQTTDKSFNVKLLYS